MKTKRLDRSRVALQIEKNRAHGRALLEGIADYAREHTDWRLELVDPAQLSDMDYVRQFDGLIVRVMDDVTDDVLIRSRRPVVDVYGRKDRHRLATVNLDDRAIAEMAFACFHERRHRSFAYCGFNGLRFSDARGAAFASCVRAKGYGFASYGGRAAAPITDSFFRNEKTAVPDAGQLGKWLASLPKPTALFCCNDLRAVQVLNVCADIGIDVPGEISVMGVDNDVLLCTFANPSLSSIDTGPVALGRKAAEMLSAQMSGRRIGKGRHAGGTSAVHAPERIVERISTDAFPFRTPWLEEAVRHIRRNLASGVTAADVVRHVGYSHPTVAKAFADELGHAVKREIMLQRGRLARDLLRDTGLTLAEIADRCGYLSPQYFSRSFSAEFRMTPDAWRTRFGRFRKS